jgi:hypothetical protein
MAHPIINRKQSILIASLLMCMMIIAGCYYDIEPNPGTCDTNNVTYSATIASIIQSNGCLTPDCHGGNNPISGIRLTDYNSVKAMETRLFGAINHSSGFVAMPQNSGKISQCEIDKVQAWINAGAPNN